MLAEIDHFLLISLSGVAATLCDLTKYFDFSKKHFTQYITLQENECRLAYKSVFTRNENKLTTFIIFLLPFGYRVTNWICSVRHTSILMNCRKITLTVVLVFLLQVLLLCHLLLVML